MRSEKEIRREEEEDIRRGKRREETQSGEKWGVMQGTDDLREAEGGSEKGRASVQAMIEEGPENSGLDGRLAVEPYNQTRVTAKSPLQVLNHNVISGRADEQNKVLKSSQKTWKRLVRWDRMDDEQHFVLDKENVRGDNLKRNWQRAGGCRQPNSEKVG